MYRGRWAEVKGPRHPRRAQEELATLGKGEKKKCQTWEKEIGGERGNRKVNKEERNRCWRDERVLWCGLCEANPTPSLSANHYTC